MPQRAMNSKTRHSMLVQIACRLDTNQEIWWKRSFTIAINLQTFYVYSYPCQYKQIKFTLFGSDSFECLKKM